jgi:antitoxin YefM
MLRKRKLTMETLSYTAFRQNLAGILDKVNVDHVPIMVTRQNGEPAIVMSVKDYNSYYETAYLMGSAKNIERLNKAIADVESGNVL